MTVASSAPRVTRNTGNNEWYTPDWIVEAARKTMGGIDLDPASCDEANQNHVRASEYFTKEDNGLERDWFGRVYMNPPYSGGVLPSFVAKLSEELSSLRVSEAIVLVNNGTETKWCQDLFLICSAVCFLRSRVHFYKPGGGTGPPLQGQALFYFGNHRERFAENFSNHGFICYPHGA